MVGGILSTVASAACLLSVLSYVECHRRGYATLLYLILTHQFQYTNVWSYSSRELSGKLADLEVTFLDSDFSAVERERMLQGGETRIGAQIAVKK